MNNVSLKLVESKYNAECYASNGGYVIDCEIEPHLGQSHFGYNKDGFKIITLRDYAIIPKSKYYALLEERREKTSFWRRIFGRI